MRSAAFNTVFKKLPITVGEMAIYTGSGGLGMPENVNLFDLEVTWQLVHWQNAPMIP